VSAAAQLYASTLIVYFFANVIACWGLDLQFGVTGVLNFAFVVFQAVGAYAVALLSLGPASASGGFQRYLGGWSLSFPVPLLGAMLAGAVLAAVIGWVGLRRLRADYQAMVMLVVSVIATLVVSSEIGLVNGPAGLSLIPRPFAGALNLAPARYSWFFAGLCGLCCAGVGLVCWRLEYSPYGRMLRGVRDNEQAVEALGRSARRARMQVFVLGGAFAALSGALLAQFVTAWAPNGWEYPETFVFFTAVIVGGRGSLWGVALGAAVVAVGVQQAVQYLPIGSDPTVLASVEWIITGVITLGFIWFRPQGLIPERRRRFRMLPGPQSGAAPLEEKA
jgi:ABC-type branched-subunit amino acid transport system permease subunit